MPNINFINRSQEKTVMVKYEDVCRLQVISLFHFCHVCQHSLLVKALLIIQPHLISAALVSMPPFQTSA